MALEILVNGISNTEFHILFCKYILDCKTKAYRKPYRIEVCCNTSRKILPQSPNSRNICRSCIVCIHSYEAEIRTCHDICLEINSIIKERESGICCKIELEEISVIADFS